MSRKIQAYTKPRPAAKREIEMTASTGTFYIIGILALVLLIGILRNRAEWILNFILRGVSGMMAMYFVNMVMRSWAPGMEMGYNPITFLTSGILGFPGVALLYGINLYMRL